MPQGGKLVNLRTDETGLTQNDLETYGKPFEQVRSAVIEGMRSHARKDLIHFRPSDVLNPSIEYYAEDYGTALMIEAITFVD